MSLNLVIAPIPQPDPNGPPPPGVTEHVVRRNGGPPVIERVIDLHGENFAAAFSWVFAQNVKAARAENERLTGNPDGIVPVGRD
jgi:hypothetical protein